MKVGKGKDIADYYLKNHNLRYDAQWNQDEYNIVGKSFFHLINVFISFLKFSDLIR